MRTISPTATPLPTAYGCVAVYIAGGRTNLVVYGCRPKPTTKKASWAYLTDEKLEYSVITLLKQNVTNQSG